MASVTLEDLFLHEADDNSIFITAVLTGEHERTSKPGEVRRYAGGRLRSVTRAGSSQTLDVELRLADRADVDQLRAWVETGTQLMYREPLGRKLWGAVFGLDVKELPGVGGDVADVSFTFEQTSFTEAV